MTHDRTDDVIRSAIAELVAAAPEPKPLAATTNSTESARRWLASVAAVLLIVGAIVATALVRDGGPGAVVTDPDTVAPPPIAPSTSPSPDPDAATSTAVTTTPSSAPSAPPSAVPATTPISSAPTPGTGPITPGEDPISAAGFVAATPDGVLLSTDKVQWSAVGIAGPAEGRALLIGRFVVHQRSTSGLVDLDEISIVTVDGSERWTPREGWYGELLDVGFVDGEPTMLVSTGTQPNPDDADVRLLLVDLATRAETDLGSIGGWEEGPSSGVLGDDAIALKMSVNTAEWVDVVALDGSPRFSVELDDDRGWTVSGSGDTVWAYRFEFDPPDFTIPVIVMHEIDLVSGEVSESRHTLVDASGVPLIETGCFPSWLDHGLLGCGTDGMTVEIQVGPGSRGGNDGGQNIELPGFVTARRLED